MEPKLEQKWYQKKRYIIPAVFILGIVAANGFSNNSDDQTPTQIAPVVISTSQSASVNSSFEQKPLKQTVERPVPQNKESGLSNNNYYTNTAGNRIHSPANSNETPE